MPLPLIPGVVRCAASGVVPSGQVWVNVHHARYAGGASSPGTSDIDALHAILVRLYAGTIFTGGTTWIGQNCAAGVKINQISYTPLDGISLTTVIPVGISGTGTNSTPSECSPVLTIRSATRGRANRGRIYLPCPSNVNVSADGRLMSTVATSTVAQYNAILGALGGPSTAPFWELGVASYKHVHFAPATTGTMDLDVDVQRRRKK